MTQAGCRQAQDEVAWRSTRQLLAGAVADPAVRLDQAGPGGAVRRVAGALKSLGDKP